MPPADWLRPDWATEAVGALATSRNGGVSAGPFGSMNIGDAVGDEPLAVAANRERLRQAIGGALPVYLRQVHGRAVAHLGRGGSAGLETADASVTAERGIACVVQVADCLPVLFAAPGCSGVAAAHAGWRGLAGGVLEATVEALCRVSGAPATALRAWLGPCIGPAHFEVGADVVEAFLGSSLDVGASAAVGCFVPAAARPAGAASPGAAKWRADLAGLARLRLRAAGLRQISGGGGCTVSDASRFFSFRRDRVCGRMAAAVWIR